MKHFFALIIIIIIMVFVLPLEVFFVIKPTIVKPKPKTQSSKDTISVYFKDEDKIKTMKLDDYLKGVVCAEMPASFESEALKAQAVAARSFALYRAKTKNPDHPDADVCTDYMHCKAYKTLKEAQKSWQEDKDMYTKKISNAVDDTSGEIIKYKGEVALAVFHAQAGGGRTENSCDVWGGNMPYLVSVESPGEEKTPGFYSTAEFSFDEFKAKILKENPQAIINSCKDIGETVKSEGGAVKEITIGSQKFTGVKIRTIFSLRSSCFRIIADDKKVIFEVEGYGHGVGMSQYGANCMAKEGYTYKQILTHYYSGTNIDYI